MTSTSNTRFVSGACFTKRQVNGKLAARGLQAQIVQLVLYCYDRVQGGAGEKPELHSVARESECVQFPRYRMGARLLREETRERRESTGYIQNSRITNRTRAELDNQRSIWNSMETKR